MTTTARTRRRPLHFEGDDRKDSETPRPQRDSPRASTAGRMATRSDMIVVSPAAYGTPPPGGNPTSTVNGKGVRRERVRDKHGRYTDGKATTGKMLVIEIPKPKSSGSNTPLRQSSNDSPSGTAIPRPGSRINLRSKGSSSSSSSDHEDTMPIETLDQLTTSLKSAQIRAKSLSANFGRLMRLVLDEEIEAVERDIALVKTGRHFALRVNEEDAEAEREAKKRITKARRVAAEHEIDIRFGAMVDAEWQRFKDNKASLRGKMCEDLSLKITKIRREVKTARSISLGIKPDIQPQQAPWWRKIPKQFTWFNLPLGATDHQLARDLDKMGIRQECLSPSRSSLGEGMMRTPSPEDGVGKKRHRRWTEDEWEGRKRRRGEQRKFDDRFPHLEGPPEPPRRVFVQEEFTVDAMDSLLDVVEEDIQSLQTQRKLYNPPPLEVPPPVPLPTQFFPPQQLLFPPPQPPPPPSLPLPEQQISPRAADTFRPSLLPRPSMMPVDPTLPYIPPLQTFVPKHIPRHPPPAIVPLRLDNPPIRPPKGTDRKPSLPPILDHPPPQPPQPPQHYQPIQPQAPPLHSQRHLPPEPAPPVPPRLNLIAPRPEKPHSTRRPLSHGPSIPSEFNRGPVKLLPKGPSIFLASRPTVPGQQASMVRTIKDIAPPLLPRESSVNADRSECEMKPLKRLIEKTAVVGTEAVEKRASMGRWDDGEEGPLIMWVAESSKGRKTSDYPSSVGTRTNAGSRESSVNVVGSTPGAKGKEMQKKRDSGENVKKEENIEVMVPEGRRRLRPWLMPSLRGST